MVIEACVNSAMSAIEAQAGGAGRVELCENLHDGGTTPSAGAVRLARERLHIRLFVMIRPRGGDFLYSEDEFRIMQEDIRVAKELGADGVVFGILRPDGTIDTECMRILCGLARPMGITCHRAFDMTVDPFRAMDELIDLGIDRILTSGQQPTAPQGAALIRDLVARAAGRITIMPGSGVKEHNIVELVRATGVSEVHIHLEKPLESEMTFRQPSVYMGKPDQSEFSSVITDRERISRVKELLQC